MRSIFQFTLILKNIPNVSCLEDCLYEAGCADALVNFRNDTVYLDFDRVASSLEDAVISAIKNVLTMGAEVAGVAPDNLVTISEIAKRLNVTRQIVSLWIKKERRKSFPHPMMRITEKSPLWKWSEVVEWLYSNQIIDDEDVLKSALFFANINAALEERDGKIRKIRHGLLTRISSRI